MLCKKIEGILGLVNFIVCSRMLCSSNYLRPSCAFARGAIDVTGITACEMYALTFTYVFN